MGIKELLKKILGWLFLIFGFTGFIAGEAFSIITGVIFILIGLFLIIGLYTGKTKCDKCGKKFSLRETLFYHHRYENRVLCGKCFAPIKKRLKKEWEREKKKEEKENKAMDIIEEKMNSEELEYEGPYEEGEEGRYWLKEGEDSVSEFQENELIEAIIKNKYDFDKAIEELHREHAREAKEMQIQVAMAQIKEREERRRIREEAEKRVYGKVKTKREALSNEEKEGIFSKFNNECAVCSRKEGLVIHHKDGDPKNNAISNLIVLCGVCHKKIHMKVR